jgi:alpha-tubulin suppressor-like RCC1 family protein
MALRIQQIACGESHSLVLLSDGSVWAAGSNTYGQLGDGTFDDRTTWIPVMPEGSGVIQLAAGIGRSLALKSDGSVWATGLNEQCHSGDGMMTPRNTWIAAIPSGVTQVFSGYDHSLILKSDGSVWATGRNKYGQLGDGAHQDRFGWVPVMPSGSDVVQVVGGKYHSLALKSDGSVWATGCNTQGQLGDGTYQNKSTWISVIPSGVIQVAARDGTHSLVLKSDGAVWATGSNGLGQLGDGTSTGKSTWTSVIPSGVTQVAAGNYHSFALKSDGSLWAAGYNTLGHLGDGARMGKYTWNSVISSGVAQVAVCSSHSLALKSDGTLWKTGDNDHGQLGFEGPDSLVWIPDRFFEQMLLESLMGDDPGSMPERMPDAADDWRGLSL